MGKTGTTEKAGQPAWAKRILKLLEQAKAKDPDLMRFGAYSHKYKLSAPASEETIQKFEEQEGIRLPEEYRDFLLFVGNGGAGPYLLWALWGGGREKGASRFSWLPPLPLSGRAGDLSEDER